MGFVIFEAKCLEPRGFTRRVPRRILSPTCAQIFVAPRGYSRDNVSSAVEGKPGRVG
jgi:hypothetical protein